MNEQRESRNSQQGENRMTTKEHMNTYRTTARVVGVVYLAGFVVGIGGRCSSTPFLVHRIAFPRFPQTA